MTFDEYQQAAAETAIYPGHNTVGGLPYAALGLNGEAGEVAELVKKALRDENGRISGERRERICKEIGDVLWYCAAVARDAGISLDEVARQNVAKLQSRKARGVLGGDGSDR